MKHGKKPTRKQKMLIQNVGLNHDNWLVITEDTEKIIIQSRKTGKLRTLRKGESE